jgi:hypothetical protein
MNWISNNIAALTLIVTSILTIITLFYTLITRKMLRLASQPTITIRPKKVSIHPDIPDIIKISDSNDELGEARYCITFELDLANIGNQPAQNIYIDAEAYFKTNSPLGEQSLPVHSPEFVTFLAPNSRENDKETNVSARFDNFVARELIRDFFIGRKNMEGFPFLPSRIEMEKKRLWPSAKIIIRCLYSDIQGQNYLSQLQLFFHLWRDSDLKKLNIYVLNMQDIQFIEIKPISKRFRERYIKNKRYKRYMSFDGEEHSKSDLLLLSMIRGSK